MSNLANSKRPSDLFFWLTICAGVLACLVSSYRGGFFAVVIILAAIAAAALELTSLHEDLNGLKEIRKDKQLRVLVVDDEECIRDLLRALLETVHCSVSTAAGGHEALALFDSREFDAVFTDVGMPGMSGWELAGTIRRQRKEIPIAVITGWGEAVASSEQKEAGVNWVIAKPFTADRIFELVREIVARREIEGTRRKLSVVAA